MVVSCNNDEAPSVATMAVSCNNDETVNMDHQDTIEDFEEIYDFAHDM